MALLQLRNMPIDNSGITPAELMYGRKIRNIIPDFNKNKVKSDEFVKVLKDKQLRQKRYYDKFTKPLKEFKVGDKVKIHEEGKKVLPHKSGIIIEKHDNPRSYNVKTEKGTMITRNRKDLTKGTKFEIIKNDLDIQLDEPTDESEPVVNDNSNDVCQDVDKVPSHVPNVIKTRSGRVIIKPDYLKDYVCTIDIM